MHSMRHVFRSVGLVVSAAVLLSAGPTTLAKSPSGRAINAATAAGAQRAAVQPAGLGTYWGWVTLRDPNAVIQPAAPRDQGNALGYTNTVTYEGGGLYEVDMPRIGTIGGVANVTVLGSTNRVCAIQTWNDTTFVAASPAEHVWILCWTDAGVPAKAAFIATYTESAEIGGRLAYLWAGDWTKTNYTPNTQWNFNSTGISNTVHRNGLGDYRVTLPGLGSSKGDVQVASYGRFVPAVAAGTGPSGVINQTPTECNVASWGPHNADMRVRVLCRDLSGHLIDSQFNLTFTQAEGLKGPNGLKVAYLLGQRSATTSYTPLSDYRFSTAGTTPHVRRTGTGHYTVSLPGMPHGGGVIVTAYGIGRVRCNVTGISTGGSTQRVGVRCRNFSGHPRDSEFTLSYLH